MTQSKHLKLPRTSGAFPNSFLNVFGNFLISAETGHLCQNHMVETKRKFGGHNTEEEDRMCGRIEPYFSTLRWAWVWVLQKSTGSTRARTITFCLIALSFLTCAVAQQTAVWRDPSKHHVQFVTVQDGVRLEVLDWGGAGQAVVLLAGYQTAHEYDGFAEKLSETCHVYGITRRGYGSSSRPDSGYTAQRSADDVLQVLDSLKLSAPVLVGHSFGGQDLITIGAQHSDRIAGLVFLNSAEDPTLTFSAYGVEQVDQKKLPATMREPPPPDHSSFRAYREWQMRTHGVMFPESELRQQYAANPDGSVGRELTSQFVRDAIFAGREKPDYPRIRVPVLALFALPRSLQDQIQQYKPKDAEERAAMEQQHAIHQAIVKKHIRDLQNGVPAARVVVLPGANYYIFLSNETDVLRELRAFMTTLH